jgi:hypothetical protein
VCSKVCRKGNIVAELDFLHYMEVTMSKLLQNRPMIWAKETYDVSKSILKSTIHSAFR